MGTSFTVHAISLHEPIHTTPTQQQQNTMQSSLLGWVSEKCVSVAGFVGNIVSDRHLIEISEFDRSRATMIFI